MTASYSKPSVARWKLEKMNVELARYLAGNAGDQLSSIAWCEHAVLRIKPKPARITVDQAIDVAQRTEDLLILLADCNRSFDFPRLRVKPGEPGVRLYFARSSRPKEEREKWDKVWVPFGACDDQFGGILETWLEKHEIYGSGFHLYLGNRRGHPMYWEHRFASLMWGLESLHRSLVPTKENEAQAAKVKRIVEQIAKARDRKWAERHLPKQSEPTLATRIADLLSMLPLRFDKAELVCFAERCAARRNDVSHFGGVRRAGDYNDFIQDIVKLSGAIDVFYHALLLQIAGVPGERIAWYFLQGVNASLVQEKLLECGLTVMAKE
ncbi:HEPN domain-containing protein [Alteriqipengyuania lutimaris]|uniref:HEPN domain-containing protein n=1 Tax=Alteriqipengyuania lutimaris TaxID=1538146 RepID=UPI0039AEEA83